MTMLNLLSLAMKLFLTFSRKSVSRATKLLANIDAVSIEYYIYGDFVSRLQPHSSVLPVV